MMTYYIQQVPRITLNMSLVWMGLATGFMAGAVTGVAARLAMRLVALYTDSAPSFSWGGTLAIIFVFAIILGLPLGLLYLAVRQYLPSTGMVNGLIYGLLLFLILVVIPFYVGEALIESTDEFANLTAGKAAVLFAPVPIVFGLSVAWFMGQLELNFQSQPVRPVSLIWLALLSLAAILAVVSMGSLLNSRLIIPKVFVGLYQALGQSFTTSRLLHLVGTLAYLGLYIGLCLRIFWRSSRTLMGKFTAVALLLFAAAYFSTHEQLLSTSIRAAMANPLIVAVLQAVGLAVLVLWMMLFPDGRFGASWNRWAYYGLVVTLAFGVAGELLGIGASDALMEALLIPGLVIGWLAFAQRFRQSSDVTARRQLSPVFWGTTAAIGAFLILLTATWFEPELIAWTFVWPDGVFSFGPYLLGWLLLPLSVYFAIRKRKLWQADSR